MFLGNFFFCVNNIVRCKDSTLKFVRYFTAFIRKIKENITFFRSNALPFIQRGNYVHLHGSRKGKAYSILDISAGKDLTFVTEHQSSLPDTLKTKQTASFRITEVDEENKNKLLYDGCKTLKDRALVDDMIRTYKQEEMSETIMLLTNIQGKQHIELKEGGAWRSGYGVCS